MPARTTLQLPESTIRLAEAQHGLLLRSQLHHAGLNRSSIERLLDRGILVSLTPVLVRIAGSPASNSQAALAAVLDAGQGGAVSHESAAALWELPGFRLLPVDVTRFRDRSRRQNRLGTQHSARRLLPHHVAVLEGVPVTTPTRTLFDLAASLHPGRLERAVDTAWARHLVSWRSMSSCLAELEGRGRAGIVAMRAILDARGPDYLPAESNLERRFEAVLADRGLPPMRRQVNVGGDGWLARVDYVATDGLPFIVQVDSDRFHTALVDAAHDERQTSALTASGWVVERLTEFQVWYRPDEVVAAVHRGRHQARSMRRAA